MYFEAFLHRVLKAHRQNLIFPEKYVIIKTKKKGLQSCSARLCERKGLRTENMDSVISIKTALSDIETEITVKKENNTERELISYIYSETEKSDKSVLCAATRVEEINKDIERLTCKAELDDVVLSAVCGVLSGRLSSVIGKIKKLGYGKVKEKKSVKNSGCRGGAAVGTDGETEITLSCLGDGRDKNSGGNAENEFNLGGENDFSDGLLENILKECGEGMPKKERKLSRSKSLIGIVFSISEQFSNSPLVACESEGKPSDFKIEVNSHGFFVSRDKNGKIFAGIVNWFFNVAEDISKEGAGKDAVRKNPRFFSTLLTLAEELSALPCLKNGDFRQALYMSFNDYKGCDDGEKLCSDLADIFCESGKKERLKKQKAAVVLNEMLLRSVFFVKGFIRQIKERYSLSLVSYRELMPYKDSTLSRMMSVSLGVFAAANVTANAVRSAAKGGAFYLPKFIFDMALKVNIVGVGRFAVNLKSDLDVKAEREELRDERIRLCGELLSQNNARVYYRQAGMWKSAEDTVKTLSEASLAAEMAVRLYEKSINEMTEDLESAGAVISRLEKNEKGFLNELDEILKYE